MNYQDQLMYFHRNGKPGQRFKFFTAKIKNKDRDSNSHLPKKKKKGEQ